MTSLKPFWRYYGGKWRAAPRYPAPKHSTIIEPFAGAAGYALRYADRHVVLVERYAVIAEMWRYLIAVSPAEVLSIPCVECVDDLPAWVPAGARSLVGFNLNTACTSPRRSISKNNRLTGCGWTEKQKTRVASQVDAIKHWRIIEGDYTQAPDVEATWFVDPPYSNRAGSYYVHASVDYTALGAWCRTRRGQTLVCENEGATWLPFKPFASLQSCAKQESIEVLWQNTSLYSGIVNAEDYE